MNPQFTKKLLQLDIKNTSILNRQEKIFKFYSYISRAMETNLKDNSPMLSPQELDQINAKSLNKSVFFSKKIWATTGKKQKKATTNQDFADTLLGFSQQSTDFVLGNRLDFSVINYDVVNEMQQGFFHEFGLTFKFCPDGVLQRPYRSPNAYIDTNFLELENKAIQYVVATDQEVFDRYGYDYDIKQIPKRREPTAYRISTIQDLEKEFQVQISKPFCILDSEITISLFEKVMGYHLNYFSEAKLEKRRRKKQSNELDIDTFTPVQNIDWDVAILFCNRLSRMLGFQPCYLDYQGKPILSMREYWELAQIGQCPEFYTWGVDESRILADRYHYPREFYELKNVDPSQIQVNWDRSANGFRLPTVSEWIWAVGTPQKTSMGKTEALDKLTGKPQINDQFQICSKTIGDSELCFDFFHEYPNAKTLGWRKKTYGDSMSIDLVDKDLLHDTTNKLKKDFCVGKPKQVSVLDYPDIPKKQLEDLKFSLRMVNRWVFCLGSLADKEHMYPYQISNTHLISRINRNKHGSVAPQVYNGGYTFRICKNID